MTNYRILKNGEQIAIGSDLLNKWSEIIERFEARYSGTITLQRQEAWTDDEEGIRLFRAGLANPVGSGYIIIKNRVICPWRTLAEIEIA